MNLILLVVFLLLSAFFSGSETALISMTKLRIRRAFARHGKRAEPLRHWQEHSERLLTTILVGNNLSNIAATSLTALVISTLIRNRTLAVVVNSVIMTSVILVFSEILPKMLAKRRPEPYALRVVRPLVGMSIVLRPVVWLFGGIAHAVAKAFGSPGDATHLISRADVAAIVEAAGQEGSLDSEERVLLEEALGLGVTRVREIMTPRIKMTTIGHDVGIDAAKELLAETGYSRLPVESPTEGEIVGVLFAKDLLLSYEAENLSAPLVVSDFMRPVHFVPEVVTIDRLLDLFRRHHVHIAIVIGEHGDVAGLATMENVLEQLVGHIEDEFDREKFEIRKISERRSLVDGSARIDDLRRVPGIEFPDGDYETVGGFLIHELGRIPPRGAAVRLKGWVLQVYEADERRVREVMLQRIGREPSKTGDTAA